MTTVKIPVTGLGDHCFKRYLGLKILHIPEYIQDVGYEINKDCLNLRYLFLYGRKTSIQPNSFIDPVPLYFNTSNLESTRRRKPFLKVYSLYEEALRPFQEWNRFGEQQYSICYGGYQEYIYTNYDAKTNDIFTDLFTGIEYLIDKDYDNAYINGWPLKAYKVYNFIKNKDYISFLKFLPYGNYIYPVVSIFKDFISWALEETPPNLYTFSFPESLTSFDLGTLNLENPETGDVKTLFNMVILPFFDEDTTTKITFESRDIQDKVIAAPKDVLEQIFGEDPIVNNSENCRLIGCGVSLYHVKKKLVAGHEEKPEEYLQYIYNDFTSNYDTENSLRDEKGDVKKIYYSQLGVWIRTENSSINFSSILSNQFPMVESPLFDAQKVVDDYYKYCEDMEIEPANWLHEENPGGGDTTDFSYYCLCKKGQITEQQDHYEGGFLYRYYYNYNQFDTSKPFLYTNSMQTGQGEIPLTPLLISKELGDNVEPNLTHGYSPDLSLGYNGKLFLESLVNFDRYGIYPNVRDDIHPDSTMYFNRDPEKEMGVTTKVWTSNNPMLYWEKTYRIWPTVIHPKDTEKRITFLDIANAAMENLFYEEEEEHFGWTEDSFFEKGDGGKLVIMSKPIVMSQNTYTESFSLKYVTSYRTYEEKEYIDEEGNKTTTNELTRMWFRLNDDTDLDIHLELLDEGMEEGVCLFHIGKAGLRNYGNLKPFPMEVHTFLEFADFPVYMYLKDNLSIGLNPIAYNRDVLAAVVACDFREHIAKYLNENYFYTQKNLQYLCDLKLPPYLEKDKSGANYYLNYIMDNIVVSKPKYLYYKLREEFVGNVSSTKSISNPVEEGIFRALYRRAESITSDSIYVFDPEPTVRTNFIFFDSSLKHIVKIQENFEEWKDTYLPLMRNNGLMLLLDYKNIDEMSALQFGTIIPSLLVGIKSGDYTLYKDIRNWDGEQYLRYLKDLKQCLKNPTLQKPNLLDYLSEDSQKWKISGSVFKATDMGGKNYEITLVTPDPKMSFTFDIDYKALVYWEEKTYESKAVTFEITLDGSEEYGRDIILHYEDIPREVKNDASSITLNFPGILGENAISHNNGEGYADYVNLTFKEIGEIQNNSVYGSFSTIDFKIPLSTINIPEDWTWKLKQAVILSIPINTTIKVVQEEDIEIVTAMANRSGLEGHFNVMVSNEEENN